MRKFILFQIKRRLSKTHGGTMTLIDTKIRYFFDPKGNPPLSRKDFNQALKPPNALRPKCLKRKS